MYGPNFVMQGFLETCVNYRKDLSQLSTNVKKSQLSTNVGKFFWLYDTLLILIHGILICRPHSKSKLDQIYAVHVYEMCHNMHM